MFDREYKDAQATKNEHMRNMAMNVGMIGAVEMPKKNNSAAEEIGELAERLANLSVEIVAMTSSKLSPIMRDCGPEEDGKAIGERNMPPYFGYLRMNLQTIETNLHRVIDCIQRTDI